MALVSPNKLIVYMKNTVASTCEPRFHSSSEPCQMACGSRPNWSLAACNPQIGRGATCISGCKKNVIRISGCQSTKRPIWVLQGMFSYRIVFRSYSLAVFKCDALFFHVKQVSLLEHSTDCHVQLQWFTHHITPNRTTAE